MSDKRLFVVFRVGETEYAISAADVLQMESFAGATPVPGTPAHVAGLVQVRGRVVPVVDLRARFGLPPVEKTLDSRVIVVQDGTRTVGLLVDAAREVVHLASEALEAPPEVVARQGQGFVKAVARANQRLVMLVDFQKIVGEELPHA